MSPRQPDRHKQRKRAHCEVGRAAGPCIMERLFADVKLSRDEWASDEWASLIPQSAYRAASRKNVTCAEICRVARYGKSRPLVSMPIALVARDVGDVRCGPRDRGPSRRGCNRRLAGWRSRPVNLTKRHRHLRMPIICDGLPPASSTKASLVSRLATLPLVSLYPIVSAPVAVVATAAPAAGITPGMPAGAPVSFSPPFAPARVDPHCGGSLSRGCRS